MNSLSFSLGGGSSSKSTSRHSPPPTKRSNGTKRDHTALLDDASDDEDTFPAKRQTITHFDTSIGGAVNAQAVKKEEKGPLVITALANRDWREASKRQRAQKYGISDAQLDARKEQHVEGNAQGADTVVKETEAVKYGLNVFAPITAAPEDVAQEEQQQQQEEDETPQQKTADQLAIDALTGAAPVSTLTIPAAAATEEDAFASTFHSAPPAPTLSDYTAVPVEEYGAAMLRGMGWKGPSTVPSAPTKNGKKPMLPTKRPALLGIGADPNAAKQAEELGAWGKTSARRGKEPTMFIPVSMKNKRTGETLTEEELKSKIRKDKEEAENNRFVVNDLEIREKKSSSRRDGDARRNDQSDDEERRRRRDRDRDHDRHDKPRDHRDNRKDTRDRSRDQHRDQHRDSRRDGSRDRYDKKSSSHRRDRSVSKTRDRDYSRKAKDEEYGKRDRDRDYDRRDRDRDNDRRDRDKDYERKDRDRKDSGKRDRYEDSYKSSSRRDRDGDGYHRSSRR
ncbi:hypothetical protein E4T45_04575 [Aureobasidium sp. EXF-8846]|nr:hypothetical protein E4T45_04575 [Aureobasidium sp. EXF-8846]